MPNTKNYSFIEPKQERSKKRFEEVLKTAEFIYTNQKDLVTASSIINMLGLADREKIFDLLEKAVEVSDSDGANGSIIEGVKLTLENLRMSFEAEGISEIEALGKVFDPTCMEAIATIPCPDDKEPGSVVEVIESGYRMHERILRASRVVVAEGDS